MNQMIERIADAVDLTHGALVESTLGNPVLYPHRKSICKEREMCLLFLVIMKLSFYKDMSSEILTEIYLLLLWWMD